MKRTKIILGAVAGLLAVGATFAFKAVNFIPVPNVYYQAAGACQTLPYTTNLSAPAASFTITTTGYYTVKLSATTCANPIATPKVVERTSPQ